MKENKIHVFIISNGYEDKDWVYGNEFVSLLLTAGYTPVGALRQNVEVPNAATYVGKGFLGKVKEYLQLIPQNWPEISEVIVATDFDLTGTQRANIKNALGVEVIDRTFVILKIFENNAHSKEAKLQVDIATLYWSKNHLVNKEGAYSQVTSGGGMHNKGSGEKQISLDKRHINYLIDTKKRELEKIKLARKNSRTKRNNSGLYKIAIVGYTNSGKSTLLNSLISFSKGEKYVLTKDQQFATLETSTREISKFGFMKFLATDTVGFIRDLPTTLIDAFRSTLEEIKEADLLVHVVDISSKTYQEEIETTNEVLDSIGVKDIPSIYLFNKYDLLDKSLSQLLKENEMYCSLLDGEDIENIYRFICSSLAKTWPMYEIEFPFEQDFNQFSNDNYITNFYKNKNGYQCTVYLNPRTAHKYSYLLDKNS